MKTSGGGGAGRVAGFVKFSSGKGSGDSTGFSTDRSTVLSGSLGLLGTAADSVSSGRLSNSTSNSELPTFSGISATRARRAANQGGTVDSVDDGAAVGIRPELSGKSAIFTACRDGYRPENRLVTDVFSTTLRREFRLINLTRLRSTSSSASQRSKYYTSTRSSSLQEKLRKSVVIGNLLTLSEVMRIGHGVIEITQS